MECTFMPKRMGCAQEKKDYISLQQKKN